MIAVRAEAEEDADFVKQAPYSTPVRRLDDVKAARELDLTWSDISAG
jgi:glycine dehydrogenase subunit 2